VHYQAFASSEVNVGCLKGSLYELRGLSPLFKAGLLAHLPVFDENLHSICLQTRDELLVCLQFLRMEVQGGILFLETAGALAIICSTIRKTVPNGIRMRCLTNNLFPWRVALGPCKLDGVAPSALDGSVESLPKVTIA